MSDLSSVERLKIEALFGMESGYVLGFSNNTFSMFTVENVGIDIFDSKYEYGSSSKANRLRKFWLEESNEVVGKLLSALLDYWLAKKQTNGDQLSSKEKTLYDECQKIVSRLNQDSFRQIQENTSSPSQKGGIFSNGTDVTDIKLPLKVFLCHAHADRNAVHALYVRLTNDGVDAWLDKEKLLPGQDWELEIRKAVREADVVVVCLSKQFNQAGFRQKEVRLALDTAMEKPEGEIFIIPARLDECENLESLRKWHLVDLFQEGGYQMLVRALHARADKIGATLRIQEDKLSRGASTKSIEKRNSGKNFSQDTSFVIDGYRHENIAIVGGHDFSLENRERSIPKAEPSVVLKPKKQRRKLNTSIVVALIGAVATIVVGLLNSPFIEKRFSITPTQIETVISQDAIISTAVFLITQTIAPTQTPTQIHTPTSTGTLLPTEITDAQGVPMVLVPAGEFIMGAEDGEPDELPVHIVYLHSFYIDKTEVTNAMYKLCVNEKICTLPANDEFYKQASYANYPIVYVSWNDANKYCKWAGKKLPTEAEWEKAARGTDGRTYPWGNGIDCRKANYSSCFGSMRSVGFYVDVPSPYGVLDVVGNAWEWVSDWYSESYYEISPYENPQGLSSGVYRGLRGGSWESNSNNVRLAERSYDKPSSSNAKYSFRCASSVP